MPATPETPQRRERTVALYTPPNDANSQWLPLPHRRDGFWQGTGPSGRRSGGRSGVVTLGPLYAGALVDEQDADGQGPARRDSIPSVRTAAGLRAGRCPAARPR